MAMGVEFELKFRATPEQLDKVEQGISGAVNVLKNYLQQCFLL